MLLKLGVDISRLKPPIRKKLNMIEAVFKFLGIAEPVITETYEGDHSPGSLHYADLAIGFRRPKDPRTVCQVLGERLGDDYDVVDEGTHIHVEYDPKRS